MVDPLLKAYAATVLAKDASSRYSNPNRALRNYNNIMEDAERGDLSHKEEMKQYAKAAIKEANSKKIGADKALETLINNGGENFVISTRAGIIENILDKSVETAKTGAAGNVINFKTLRFCFLIKEAFSTIFELLIKIL